MSLEEKVLNIMKEHNVVAVDLSRADLSKFNGGGYITGYKPGSTLDECLKVHDAVNALVNTSDVEAGDAEWVCTCILNTMNPEIPDRFLRKGRDY